MKKGAKSIDFSKYRVRKNPFAKRIKREGIELLHEGPSPSTLKAIPELGPSRRTKLFAVRHGRASTAVELDEVTWRKLEERAKAANLRVDEWLRRLIAAVA